MAASVNKVILVGALGKDPESRSTQSGMKIVSFSMATSESWTDKQSGERKEQTEWHRIVVMNEGLGGVAERYLKKGSKVYLEGKLQTRKWTDQSGVERFTTEILLGRFGGTLVLLDGKKNADGQSAPQRPAAGGNDYARGSQGWDRPAASGADLDDEIPF